MTITLAVGKKATPDGSAMIFKRGHDIVFNKATSYEVAEDIHGGHDDDEDWVEMLMDEVEEHYGVEFQ